MSARTSEQLRHVRSGSQIERDRGKAMSPMSRQRSTTARKPDTGRSGAAPLEMEHRFGCSEPFSLGVEEELFVVDPLTGRQTNTAATVLERLGELQGTVAQELHACQVELITSIHVSAGDAVRALGEMRRAVLQTRTGLLASGTHPSAREGAATITHKARYERSHDLLADAAVTPISALHVHVGMPDPETAIRTFNGLRRQLPLLVALAANSPFR